MKTLAKLTLIVTALATTACDQYLVNSGLAHGDQLAPPPARCNASDDDSVSTVLTCTDRHRSTLVAP